jgi:hypothetical protein
VNFNCQSHILCICCVTSKASANTLTDMIVEQLLWHGGFLEMDLVKKMIYFKADGALV